MKGRLIMAKFKKYLALTLVLLLMLPFGGIAAAEDAAGIPDKGAAGTFDIETVCYDWGQAVETLYLNLSDALPAGATQEQVKDAFTVKALGITYYSYADSKTYTEDFDRVIESAAISADRKTVTLELQTNAFDTANNVNFTSYSLTQDDAIDSLTARSIVLTKGAVFDEVADQFARYEIADTGLVLPYRLYTPTGSSSAKKPLIVWLHGGGEFGSDNNAQLTANLVTNWASDDAQKIFSGAYVLAPQSPAGQGGHKPENIMAVIEHVMENNKNIDSTRIYVGGCSMGGMGTWDTILAYPDFFAAAFPICPAREPSEDELKTLKKMNIWIIHAANDNVCDASLGINAYDKLIDLGAENTHFTLFDYVTFDGMPDTMKDSLGHWSWVYVHRNFPSADNADRIVADAEPLTTEKGTVYASVTSENPIDLGYDSFMHWLAAQKNMPFSDVKKASWYYDDVYYAWENELMNGLTPTTFGPGRTMTRGMLVTVLGRADGVDTGKYTGESFTDVSKNSYYAPYVEWAKVNNIVDGVGNNRFSPQRSITRAEIALVLTRYADYKKIDLPKTEPVIDFKDIKGIQAESAIQALTQAGVINGKTPELFVPNGTALRSEVAALMHRFLEIA